MNNNKEWKIDDVIKYLSSKVGAETLLADLGIKGSYNFVDYSKLKFDHFRCGIILKEIPIENRAPLDIAIDLKLGPPTTDQVCDLVYGYGRSCSMRIILFNDYETISDSDNIGADELIVSNLVDAMNQYPLGLYLAKVYHEDSDAGGFTFEKVNFPEDDPVYGMNDLPTIEKFKETEFWFVYYDGVDKDHIETLDVFSEGIHNSTQFTIIIGDLNFDITLVWNNEGVTYSTIVPYDYLVAARDVFLRENENGVDPYQDCEKSITITADRNIKIMVKAWEFPLSRLCGSDYSEKKGYGMLIKAGFWKFNNIIEGLFETK